MCLYMQNSRVYKHSAALVCVVVMPLLLVKDGLRLALLIPMLLQLMVQIDALMSLLPL